jgi:hypothetical protein
MSYVIKVKVDGATTNQNFYNFLNYIESVRMSSLDDWITNDHLYNPLEYFKLNKISLNKEGKLAFVDLTRKVNSYV